MKIKIIGLGSPHGDDQAGWEVIRLLQQQTLPENVELLALDRPGLALPNYFDGADKVILIDACDAGWMLGEWQQFSLEQLLDCAGLQGGSSHQLGVADSLQLAAITGVELPAITVICVQIGQCGQMEAMSPELFTSSKRICNNIHYQLNYAAVPSGI
ncbi:hydrogenase maturation protease [Amphritea balenae]|uniref:hydrogenase maturation protease n=1 Tax=Amphritea balenae TaxID=452629 RepID=UPI001474897A|nr:hydrogenase maturation protease [Amphritea balenae]GGK65650.1 hypothetical protein GCM10007941_14810 [Amphritea balenae]